MNDMTTRAADSHMVEPPKGMNDLTVLSADSHMVEPPNLWVERVDKRYRDRAPRVVSGHGGKEGEFFVAEGAQPFLVANFYGAGVSGADTPQFLRTATVQKNAPASVWDPAARLKEQDVDGVKGEVLFTSYGFFLFHMKDGELRTACFRAYNDFLAEYCNHDPNRLVGLALISLDDIPTAVAELRRCSKMGLRGAMIWVRPPAGKPYHLPEYDSFWAAAQDLDMVLNLHSHTGHEGLGLNVDQERWIVDFIMVPGEVQRSMAEMVIYGAFDRFPRLRVVSAENDCSWMPHFLYRLDHYYEEFRFQEAGAVRLSLRPSEYVKRNIFVTFQNETGDRVDYTRQFLGAENLVWGSDYPHGDATWPNSHAVIAATYKKVPEKDIRKMVGGNVANLYRINVS